MQASLKGGASRQPAPARACDEGWALRPVKADFQASPLWAPLKQAILHLDLMRVLAGLVVGQVFSFAWFSFSGVCARSRPTTLLPTTLLPVVGRVRRDLSSERQLEAGG